jgi:pyridoxal phosphate enzyme (YggS family)
LIVDPLTIEHHLEVVRERIERACGRCGRSSNDVTLVGVTKTFPIRTVGSAVEAGLTHLAENRVQELVEKAGTIPGLLRGGSVSWYMIGHLQRNKVKEIVDFADFFHALDSLRLAKELDKRASQEDRVVPCLVQVNVSKEESKYGVAPSETHSFLDELARYEHIRVDGLMTIASFVDEPEQVRPEFRQLRHLFETYDSNRNPRVTMRHLSMGMSGDFEVAIEEGSTHVRIGSAIFGARE